MVGLSADQLARANALGKYMYEHCTGSDDNKRQDMYMLGFLSELKNVQFNSTGLYPEFFEHIYYQYQEDLEWQMEPNARHTGETLGLVNQAQLQIDSKGNYVGYEKRLEELKGLYGESSIEYKKAKSLYNVYHKETLVLINHCLSIYKDFKQYVEEYTDRSLLLGTKTEIARDYEFTAEGIEFKLCMHYDMEVEKYVHILIIKHIDTIFKPYIIDVLGMDLTEIQILVDEDLNEVEKRYADVSRMEMLDFRYMRFNMPNIVVTNAKNAYQYYMYLSCIERRIK